MVKVESGEHMGFTYEIWEVKKPTANVYWGEVYCAGVELVATPCASQEDAREWAKEIILAEVEG